MPKSRTRRRRSINIYDRPPNTQNNNSNIMFQPNSLTSLRTLSKNVIQNRTRGGNILQYFVINNVDINTARDILSTHSLNDRERLYELSLVGELTREEMKYAKTLEDTLALSDNISYYYNKRYINIVNKMIRT